MSRCFPFPPPGYEKKVRSDDIDLLAKEKHKEKKHKKDKKGKEKRDSKEKKDKDRNKGKHGERNDRKEKHKDKKKRDAENENALESQEKRSEGQPESSNGQRRHGPNGLPYGDIKDHKYVQELERRYRDDDRATGSHVFQKSAVTDQRPLSSIQSKGKERVKDTKEIDRLVNGQRATGSQVVQKITVADQRPLLSNQSREKERIKGTKEDDITANAQRAMGSLVVQKTMVTEQRPILSNQSREKERINGKKEDDRTANGQRAAGSQVVPKFMATDQRPVLSNLSREKERIKDKKDDDKTLNAQRNHVVGKSSAVEFVQNVPSIDQKRLEGIAKPIEKDVKKQIEGDRKRNGEYDSRVHKPKERDKEKKDKSKDKNKENKKEKEEKVKEISKPSDEQHRLEGNVNASLDAFSNKAADVLHMNGKNSAAGGNLGKRKELEMNGYLHENGFLPHKLPRSVSSHPVVENGRKSEPSQTALHFLSRGQEAASIFKADIKEPKINGVIGSEQHKAVSTRPSSSTVKVSENGEASAKRPHPDSKYLSEVLSIPKMEDVSNFDDQEWLFSSNGSESKKLKVGLPEIEKTPQVWAKAMQIESADVCALPYVIPY